MKSSANFASAMIAPLGFMGMATYEKGTPKYKVSVLLAVTGYVMGMLAVLLP